MLIINGIVHTMDGPVLENGFVAAENGKITAVGPMSQCPPQLGEVIDAQGGHICPGFIDAHCHLGVFGDGVGAEAEDCNESVDPCTPHLRAIDAINPLDRSFVEARESGVTTVLTGPGSANPIAGQFAAVKTVGRWVDEMVVKAPVSMKFALGENPKKTYHSRQQSPVTRMGTAAVIRDALCRAAEYLERLDKSNAEPEVTPPAYDAKLEALLPVLRGELHVHIHAHRADDIATAVRLCREFGLKYVIVHGTEGYQIADLLADAGVGVITGPCLTDRGKPELAGKTQENPAALSRAGIPVAICTDHPETPIQYLPLCAALAVRHGMEQEEALAAITRNAAAIAGLEKRLGTLSPGKDADVVVTTGHPLDWLSHVTGVWIDGKRVK